MIVNFLTRYDIREDELKDKRVSDLIRSEGIREGEIILNGSYLYMVVWDRKSSPSDPVLVLYGNDDRLAQEMSYNPYDVAGKEDLIIPDYREQKFLFVNRSNAKVVREVSFKDIEAEWEYLTHPKALCSLYAKESHLKRILD